MNKLSIGIIRFFESQGFAVVSTIDRAGRPHSSCKGLVDINSSGLIYLLDLYQGKTYENLKKNPNISITAVDEHRFTGYCLKGKARMVIGDKLKPQIIRAWESRITSRIASRLIKNVQGEKGHPRQPEALLPKPKYLIVMKTEEVVDLSPRSLKQEG